MALSTASANSELQSTYGSLLIGVFFAIFLQGVLTLQAWNYYNDFPKDPIRNKLIVSFVWILDTIHLVIICQITYHFLVVNWGFQQALDVGTWELRLHVLFVASSCFTCQLFFLHKVWILSKRNLWVTGVSFILCLFTMAWGIFTSIDLTLRNLPPSTWDTVLKFDGPVLFSSGAVSDFFLAGLLCYYLRLDRSTFKGTRSIIRQIVQYTVVTGLLTSSLELCALIMFFAKPQGLIYVAVHICLGRLYTNALLVSLNTRKNMRMSVKISSEEFPLPDSATENQKSFQGLGTKNSIATASTVIYTIEHVTQHDESVGGIEMGPVIEKHESLA